MVSAPRSTTTSHQPPALPVSLLEEAGEVVDGAAEPVQLGDHQGGGATAAHRGQRLGELGPAVQAAAGGDVLVDPQQLEPADPAGGPDGGLLGSQA